MAAEGLLHRTHGGALLPTGVADEPTYSEKAGQAAAEKKAIARLAVGLVQPGESIVLGPGTTTLALARELVARAGPDGRDQLAARGDGADERA
jgi:DeoR/GlpR family transcriptional regulator of sugar metabolism